MFDKILIANRGEIARRVIRTCRKLGVETVAVYSDVDFRSPHVREADEAAYLGPAPASQSYLVKEKLIEAALSHGCQAIHPGYGFLSENAEFARMTANAGMVFIGPSAEAIAMLGDKMASKALAIRSGVPVVPGHHEPLSDLDEARRIAREIGFPLLLKPAAGGGGRGMRIVNDAEELPGALLACQDETRKVSPTTASSLSVTSRGHATSKSRSLPTSTARCCFWASGSARCSAVIKRSLRSAPQWRLTMGCVNRWGRLPAPCPGRPDTPTPAPWSLSWMKIEVSTSWK